MQYKRFMAWLLIATALLGLTACGKTQEPVDGNALLQVMLEKVWFDTEISCVGEDGDMYFSGLPAGAHVQMYTGSG